MRTFSDIFSSIKGDLMVRSKDPLMGSFLIAWCIFNWDKLAILFFGNDEVEQRIKTLSKKISIFTDPSVLWEDKDLVFLPLTFTLFYLFILPWLSLGVKRIQNKVILSQHTNAVELDIQLAEKQKEFNKVALRANPEKEFLAEEIKNDLQSEKERTQRRHRLLECIDQRAKATKADADIKASELEKNRIELDRKKRQEISEKRRFEEQIAIHKATMASARFPATYQLMHMLSQSLREDNLTLSLEGNSNTIATLFGYVNAEKMMIDERFRTEEINKVKYLYYDPMLLFKRLEEIVEEENSDNEDLSAVLLFDHLQIMLEKSPLELVSDELLAEKIYESVNDTKYDILNSDELSGPIADTDTIFEELELEIEDFNFDTFFELKMSGRASGCHRKNTDVPGQDLSVQVIATAAPVIGKFGLSDYQLEISATPMYYGDED